ncbi:CapA family protein [Shewanella sp. T24-MNA-CIBAN-0130]|uniref:CapA family protein n=1 Tax=Shewanella sp. T24-MNA-CIBAN-0130 TaxID=3140470 RepID=UPI00331F65CD
MKIALLGDIGLFGRFNFNSKLDAENYFSDFIAVTKDCDVIVGNLETPFSRVYKEFTAKSAVLGADEKNVSILELLNIDYVNLANNHTGDFGKEGYELTKKTLDANDIKYFGIEGIVNYFEYENNKICLSGFCNMDSNPVYLAGIDERNGDGVNVADFDNINSVLQKADDAGYLNILSFHSGLEHINLPGKADVCFARYLAEKFNYVLYGHHPHVVQAYEKHKESYLFYSLGNFCFDDVYSNSSKEPFVRMTEENRTGLVPILTIENNIVINVEYIWTYLGEDKMQILDPKVNSIIKAVNSIYLTDLDAAKIKRDKLLSEFINNRKSQRNLTWYTKRLRWKYFKLILNAKKNRKLYELSFLNKLIKNGII